MAIITMLRYRRLAATPVARREVNLFVEQPPLMPLDNITELKKRVPGGKYALARAIAERARQLQNGATPLTEVKAPNPLSVAIEEILQKKVTFVFKNEEETAAAKKAANAG